MTDKGDDLEGMRLDDAAARRLIERATELDSRLASESTVAQLREAARGAGISAEAFQRALTEVRPPAAAFVVDPPAAVRRKYRNGILVGVVAAMVLIGAFVFARMVVPPPDESVRATGPSVARVAPPPSPIKTTTKRPTPVAKKTDPSTVKKTVAPPTPP